jgi:putative addiction module component (TIGR02574 family)
MRYFASTQRGFLMRRELLAELLELSPQERLDLIDELWNSLGPDDFPALTPEQEAEIDRRLDALEKDSSRAVPWEEAREYLWSRLARSK